MRRVVACLFILAIPLIASGCASDGRTLQPPSSLDPKNGSISVPTTVTTIAGAVAIDPAADIAPPVIPFTVQTPWADGGIIDAQFTCAGADVSPAITWLSPPADAVELALIVEDIDANGFIHWIIAGLDPFDPALPEGSPPIGAIEAANDFSTAAIPRIGWSGPCPPAGTPHVYRFTLYALGQQTELPTGTPAADLKAFIENASIEAAQITAIYTAS